MITIDDVYDFYSGKKVLVTGHNGFKGSWLSFWLKRMGAKVVGVSLPTRPDELWSKLGLRIDKEYVCDIGTDRYDITVNEIMAFEKPDIVFHLAAQPLVRESYDDPVGTYQTNVMGTMNVLNAMRLSGVRNGVMITTDKCYRNDNVGFPFRETDPFGGDDPYSSSKGCCEILIESMRKSYPALKYVKSARAGNVIGGGDYAKDRIIPDYFRAFKDGKSLSIRNPESTRPWQHVLEPLYGYLVLGMLEDTEGFGVNFGPYPNGAKTVQTVIGRLNATMADVYGYHGVDIGYGKPDKDKHEAKLLQLDITRALGLGWKPVLSFEETIDSIARWFYICDNGLRSHTVGYGSLGVESTNTPYYACLYDIEQFEGRLK